MTLNNRYSKVLFALGAVNLIVLLFFFFRIYSQLGCIDQDELPYILGAQSFASINYFGANTIINENVAPIGEADWYGIFYPVFYGTVMKFFSSYQGIYILTNVFLLFLSLIIIFLAKKTFTTIKWYFLSALLLFPTLLHYTFYFMPVALNVLFAVLILILLIDTYSQENKIKIALTAFVIVIATLFRPTFVFLLFSLLPLAKNYRQVIVGTIAILMVIAGANVYTALYTAPPYADNLKALPMLFQFKIVDFFSMIFATFAHNITAGPLNIKGIHSFELFTYYFTLLSPFYFVIASYRKNKIVFALSLGCLITNIALSLLYTLYPHFFIRMSAPLTVLLLYCALRQFENKKYIMLGVLFVLLLSSLRYTKYQLNDFAKRKEDFIETEILKQKLEEVNTALKNYNASSPVTVLIDRNFALTYKANLFFSALPHITKTKQVIRYTINLDTPHLLLHHKKIPIHFILSSRTETEINFCKKVAVVEKMNLYQEEPQE